MADQTLAERIDAAKKQVQSLKTEIEVGKRKLRSPNQLALEQELSRPLSHHPI